LKVAIIGSTGQLGSDLKRVFNEEAQPLTHSDIEITDMESCKKLKQLNPDVIINCAAFHKVDACEDDPEKTFKVNSLGAKNIAKIASKIGALNIYISTDYVFDGHKKGYYTEEDIQNPINVYGISKFIGEIFTKNYSDKHYNLRVASLFGVKGASGKGGNFIETMINKANSGENVRVIDDMFRSPTYTLECSYKIRELINNDLPYGTYHLTNSGRCSWYEFTKTIFSLLNKEVNIEAIKTNDLNMKAARPLNSSLSNKKIKSFNIQFHDWKSALKKYLIEKGHVK